jgi:hypothetical protein
MARKLLSIVAIAASAALALPAQAEQRRSPEQQLERALEGRVAGEPVNCVNLRTVRNSRIIDGTAILFDAGSTIYVNRPRSGAESLDRDDTQVVRSFTGQLCSIDTIRMVDPTSGMFRGSVFLGEFVPYRRARN